MNRKHYIQNTLGVVLTMTLGLTLGACSDDEASRVGEGRALHLMLGTPDTTATRALPEHFVNYDNLYTEELPKEARIQGFLASAGSDEPISGLFSFADNDLGGGQMHRTWTSRLPIEDDATFYFYGFMPKENAERVNIAPLNSNYTNGAVLTIDGLSAITPGDVCVIVGVRGHENNTDNIASLDMVSRLGKFDITIDKDENYAYLLMDHIYCSLHFSMSVNPTYAALRTIKVKQMKLYSSDGTNAVKTVNAVITVTATDDGSNPLTNIQITNDEMGLPDTPAMLYDDEDHPKELTTTPTSFRGFMAPAANSGFVLQTIYDVYDRKGNLIRQNCSAENKINRNTVQGFSELRTGDSFTINLTIKPTYLYMLSNPDLDNPTFTIE